MSELPLQPGEPWVCASCGRKVPGRIGQCRCGALAPSPTLAFDDDPAEPPAAEAMVSPAVPSRLWWWAAPGLVGLGLLIGLWVARPAEPPPASAPALEAPLAELDTTAEDEDGPFAIEDAVIIGESATTGTTVVPLPTAEPLIVEGEAPRAVEDLVAGAIDAVVMVEAGQSRGTGFFVAPTLVITNAHVVGQHASVTLRLEGGAAVAARVERLSPETDLALLRVPSPRPASAVLPLGSSRGLRAGQEVIVIGSPLGLRNTVTRGIVSALRNANGVLLVQTDAAINPGNSGGPLLDRQGRVIGVATLKQGDAESLGFAVAIDHAQALIDGRPLDRVVGSAAPTGPLNPRPTDDGSAPSETDARREQGARAFAQVIQALARRADQVDEYWGRFKKSCNGVPASRRGDREWMSLVDRAPAFTAAIPACGSWLTDLNAMAANLREDDARAREEARRAGVLPGVVRDVLRTHRMDWGQ